MIDTPDAKKRALAQQAADARAEIRALRAYGTEREILDCDVLGPQYIEACGKLDAARGGRLWSDLSPNGRAFYCARAAEQISTRLNKASGPAPGRSSTFMRELHDGLALFAWVGALLAWFFGSFVVPVTVALRWTEGMAPSILRAFTVILGVLVLGVAYNVTVAGLVGATQAAQVWWRGRK